MRIEERAGFAPAIFSVVRGVLLKPLVNDDEEHLIWGLAILAGVSASAQSNAQPEEFTATAIVNNNLGAGAGRVIIRVERWSSEAERGRLTAAVAKGPDSLLKELRDLKPVGTIRTPDSLGYNLRYAHQDPGEDGGRRIIVGTDRPIGFWEAANQPRTINYPFTVIQMELDKNGEGKGTMSVATKIIARANTVELENFASSPVMLNDIRARAIKN
ncbi:MAG: hypothetical protein K2Y23_08775 [Cyanobacteria bacterium]|nr:hypothetical protein [Cyanobacteriota bacterium]